MSFVGKFYFKDGNEIQINIGERKISEVTEALTKKEPYKDENCRFFINVDSLNYYIILPAEVINNTLTDESQDNQE